MNSLSSLVRSIAFVALIAPSFVEAAETSHGSVTLYRDTWGVPHIYADTEAGGAFGLGYAQAEDRLGDIYEAVRTGMGRMSEAFGKEHVDQDYIMRLWRNEQLAKDYWKTSPEHLKVLLEGFAAGIKEYEKQHPDKVPEHAMELEPWMFLTVGRAMILRWPIGTILDDLKEGQKRKGPPESIPMRSNQWVVGPSRSADNVPILLTDPHLTWEGLAVLYEARVHAGDLHQSGFFLIGSALVGIGHNEHVGWAMTTGGPDTSDVYEMKIRVAPLPQYEYDGEWKNAEISMISIPVKDAKPVVRPAIYTHLGPVMAEPDLKKGIAYVGASPYFDSTGLFEQSYKMVKSKTAQEFFDALGMNQLNEQNLMFADVHGTTGYLRSGATPIRPDGYDWDAPVPGNTSDTAWKGIHDAKDLVHLFNPERGYMQNCNIAPANMLVDSPLTPDKYPDYIYNVSWDTNNPRGQRTVDLLEADESVTKEEALSYAMDVHDRLASRWQGELKAALEADKGGPSRNAAFRAAAEAILAWDGQIVPEATASPVYKFWRLRCGEMLDVSPIGQDKPLDAETRGKLLDLLSETVVELTDKYGRWDIAWGDIHKVGREGQYFPVGGADFRSGDKEANFSETLLDVRCDEDKDNPGTYIANNGSMAMQLMFFHKDGIECYSCIPWGQSADPESPHFMDQGEKLYSQGVMKPTWWDKSELMQHVESETKLDPTGKF
ncbi:MAG: penicillin acylase family protein [Planctomycetaceae bacterium]|nr:penicillin acylase family protein [Planctomycetaceae bacterium]